ncbi:MAG: cobalamin-dependent protein, partial [Nanoarchaeota archaeon]
MINPPSFFLTDDKVFFSLGLLSIAGIAQKAGHEVKLFDLAGYGDYETKAQQIAQQNFDIYGITATSPQFSYAVSILSSIKAVHPHANVVIGGPHATMFASLRKRRLESMVKESELYEGDANFHSLEIFDQIIEGEELGIFEALKRLNKPQSSRWVYSGTFDDLDKLPFLPRELIDMQAYLFKDDGSPKFDIDGGPATSILSQRGCPFNCNFCSGRNIPQYRFVKSKTT